MISAAKVRQKIDGQNEDSIPSEITTDIEVAILSVVRYKRSKVIVLLPLSSAQYHNSLIDLLQKADYKTHISKECDCCKDWKGQTCYHLHIEWD